MIELSSSAFFTSAWFSVAKRRCCKETRRREKEKKTRKNILKDVADGVNLDQSCRRQETPAKNKDTYRHIIRALEMDLLITRSVLCRVPRLKEAESKRNNGIEVSEHEHSPAWLMIAINKEVD